VRDTRQRAPDLFRSEYRFPGASAWLVIWFMTHRAHQSRPPFPSHGTVLKGCLPFPTVSAVLTQAVRCFSQGGHCRQRDHHRKSLDRWGLGAQNIPLRNIPVPRHASRRSGPRAAPPHARRVTPPSDRKRCDLRHIRRGSSLRAEVARGVRFARSVHGKADYSGGCRVLAEGRYRQERAMPVTGRVRPVFAIRLDLVAVAAYRHCA
jgi:hypothetical protein